MNNHEKHSLLLMANEAGWIRDEIKNDGVFNLTIDGRDMVAIKESTYNKLLHLLKLIERADAEDDFQWFPYGCIPPNSVAPKLKLFQ